MPIPVFHDGSPRIEPPELCCFCWRPTRFWDTTKDVAVCPDDAHFRSPDEVPSKEVWCEQVQEREEAQKAACHARQREKAELERLRKLHADQVAA